MFDHYMFDPNEDVQHKIEHILCDTFNTMFTSTHIKILIKNCSKWVFERCYRKFFARVNVSELEEYIEFMWENGRLDLLDIVYKQYYPDRIRSGNTKLERLNIGSNRRQSVTIWYLRRSNSKDEEYNNRKLTKCKKILQSIPDNHTDWIFNRATPYCSTMRQAVMLKECFDLTESDYGKILPNLVKNGVNVKELLQLPYFRAIPFDFALLANNYSVAKQIMKFYSNSKPYYVGEFTLGQRKLIKIW